MQAVPSDRLCMDASHEPGMLGIVFVVIQQKLASLFIQGRLGKGLYE